MTVIEIKTHQQNVLDSIDLSGLNPEEGREIQQLITRNVDYFQSLILILTTSHQLKWRSNCTARTLSNSIVISSLLRLLLKV